MNASCFFALLLKTDHYQSLCHTITKSPTQQHKNHTFKLSWNDEAWYWAYLAIVVWDLWLMHAQTLRPNCGSQFSSDICCICVRTSTLWSGFASTSVFVENKPRSAIGTTHSPIQSVRTFKLWHLFTEDTDPLVFMKHSPALCLFWLCISPMTILKN